MDLSPEAFLDSFPRSRILERLEKDSPKIDPSQLYLAVAFLKECNLKCGYCHPEGESKITNGRNMTFPELKEVFSAAYDSGFRVFRFTGGECTVLPWFGNTLEYVMGLDPKVRVNVCTNGTTLDKHLDLFEKHKDRTSLRVSLDSLDESKREAGIEKILTPKLDANLRELVKRGVYARFNTVVTTQNVDQVMPIIEYASELGLDVKLLDMYVQDQYIATSAGNGKPPQDPFDYWKANYVDLTTLVPMLQERGEEVIESYNRDGGFGIPMYGFKINGITVILKDSTKGAFFSRSKCIQSCPLFGKSCQEGVYTPHVSSNMVLHINGCHNTQYQWNLRGRSPEEQRGMFRNILNCFQDLEHVQNPPETIQGFLKARSEKRCGQHVLQ